MKQLLQSAAGGCIRMASCLLPAGLLFRLGLGLRRMRKARDGLERGIFFKRAADFFCLSLRPARVTARARWGDEEGPLRVVLSDPCHYDFVLGRHEAEVVRWFAGQVRPGMTVMDIGSNVGYYALLASIRVGLRGRVVALEPDPDVAQILSSNAAANHLANLEVVAAAAGSAEGSVRFGRARATGWSGQFTSRPLCWIEVPACTIDGLMTTLHLEKLDLVKIDVEGAEEQVLAGMENTLRTQHPVILLEVHGYRTGEKHAALARLEQAGYALEVLRHTPEQTHVVARWEHQG